MSRKHLALLAAALLTAVATPAAAQVKIGVLSDMNSLYADITGKGTGVAARMAAEDFGPVLGKPVEIVTADHQDVIWLRGNLGFTGQMPSDSFSHQSVDQQVRCIATDLGRRAGLD